MRAEPCPVEGTQLGTQEVYETPTARSKILTLKFYGPDLSSHLPPVVMGLVASSSHLVLPDERERQLTPSPSRAVGTPKRAAGIRASIRGEICFFCCAQEMLLEAIVLPPHLTRQSVNKGTQYTQIHLKITSRYVLSVFLHAFLSRTQEQEAGSKIRYYCSDVTEMDPEK